MNRRIKVLDDKTINKIAAGEVIERPSSVIKELIENSIDAKSSSIILEIKNGGKDYIRITDDGIGIEEEDINLAFLRHSTSKISSADDLNSILSLGFRGEALASIAAVSQLTLLSKTKNSISGKQVEINGGNIVKEINVGCPNGTTIIVKNLFYNIPVRKTFLKSESAETTYITDIIQRLSLSYPQISFKYIRDNKVILSTPGNNNLLKTIYSIFGKEFSNSLFKINDTNDILTINGYTCNPSFTRGNRGHQYIFINGRIVNSKMISKTVEDAYKSLIPLNRYPIFLLYLEIDTNEVDVNVHPTKTEVRFQDEKKILSIINTVIKNILNSHNLIPETKFSYPKKNKNDIIEKNFIDYIEETKDKIDDNQSISNDKINLYNDNLKSNNDYVVIKEEGINFDLNENNTKCLKSTFNAVNNVFSADKIDESNKKIPEMHIIGRLFSTYIIAEGIEDKILYLIDQHAAHERINYEKYKKQFNSQSVVIQNLIAPEVINLTYKEVELIKDNLSMFNKLGFDVEEFGINSVILRSVPMIFGKPNSKNLFLDILDKLEYEINSTYEIKEEKIMKLACTNSIKGGDTIYNLEIKQLLKDLNNCKDPYTCPHGRPILIKMTKYEIEKRFKRIQ